MIKKRVPLIVVADKDKADYIISSTVRQTRPNQPAVVVNNTNMNVNNRSSQGSIRQTIGLPKTPPPPPK